MKTKFNIHGVISLLLFVDALGLALFSIAEQSLLMAGIYLILILGFFVMVSTLYCSKCVCRDNCVHVVIGRLSKLLSKARQGKYTFSDVFFGVVAPILPLITIPQFYLYHNIVYLILFWILMIVAVIEVLIFVCKSCRNTECLLCKYQLEQAKR